MMFRYLRWMGGACMDVTGAGTAVSGVANAAASIASATIQADAAKSAAKMQVDSANRSADLVQGRYTQSRGDLAPFRQVGTDAAAQITPDRLGQFGNGQQMTQGGNLLDTAYNSIPDARTVGTMPDVPSNVALPPRMTQAELEQTPGYQFTRQQGLQAVQNSAAARGLGVSGAALKGAATFATGLADSTYQQQFAQQQQLFSDAFQQGQARFGNQQQVFSNQTNQNQLLFANQQQRFSNLGTLNSANQGNLQNAYNRLTGLTAIGQNSAAQTGALGSAAANAAGGFMTGGAAAGAAGLIAGGNAAAGGINGIGNAFSQYQAQNRLFGDSGGGMYGGSGVSSQYAQTNDPFGGSGRSS